MMRTPSPEVATGIAWKKRVGMSRARACALIAAVSAFELDGFPVWPLCVTRIVKRKRGPLRAGEQLIDLMRAGYLADAGWMQNMPLYRPTGLGMALVREWAGRTEAEAAA